MREFKNITICFNILINRLYKCTIYIVTYCSQNHLFYKHLLLDPLKRVKRCSIKHSTTSTSFDRILLSSLNMIFSHIGYLLEKIGLTLFPSSHLPLFAICQTNRSKSIFSLPFVDFPRILSVVLTNYVLEAAFALSLFTTSHII